MAANAGLPEAMNSLGDAYYSGDIREKNIDKALTWYEKAAKLGYGPAQFNAGIVLLRRTSNKRDLRQAIYYFDKAYHNKSNFKELAIMALRYKVEAIEKQKGTKNTRN
jgi:TPR repeat protein